MSVVSHGPWAIELRPSPSRQSNEEAEVDDASGPVPADHRAEWMAAWGEPGREVLVRDSGGACRVLMHMSSGNSRTMPFHQLWRIERFGSFSDLDALSAGLEGLAAHARSSPRVLLVSVGLMDRDPDRRSQLIQIARSLGFRPAAEPRHYTETLAIPLDQDPNDVLAAMRPSARRGIRAIDKNDLWVAPITNPAFAPSIAETLRETMARTYGPVRDQQWGNVIDFCSRWPGAARLVGTFGGDRDRPRLLAFALGLRQGDHVEYRSAGSTRHGVRFSVGHALAWDLMKWGQETGATWFDFGGLPVNPKDKKPLAGIVRFKRSFGGEQIPFREEWVLRPRPVRAALHEAVSIGLRRLLRRPPQ